jgi:dUTP pyrophosphatase
MELKIKYFDGARELVIEPKGNLIDVYANDDVFVPYMGQAMIPLGFALQLPAGYIAKLYPRSSSFKAWGIIQTNHVGIIDETYCGDNDQWFYPVQCTQPKQVEKVEIYGKKVTIAGTWIKKGDKIAQFEIVKATPLNDYKFEKVEHLGNYDRGGFGSTGKR